MPELYRIRTPYRGISRRALPHALRHAEYRVMPLVRAHGGGALRPLMLSGEARAAERKRAATLPQVRITSREKGDLVMLGIGGFTPFEHCAVPGTGIGYLEIPTFFDRTIPARVRRALGGLAAAGALDGLVLDVRNNGGGSTSVLLPVLDLFTDGVQGYFVASEGSTPLEAIATDLSGSQSVPLAILADEDTVSFGEVFTGVLQNSGRASFVGEPTRGNVEVLYGYAFIDGSELWLAHATFEPLGLPAGVWEGVGVQPDVTVPMTWELFGEADDPGLAAAVGALLGP